MKNLSHEQLMVKAWDLIHELRITESKEDYNADENFYLVENIHQVRDALYSDLEKGILDNDDKEEDLDGFFKRHKISYK